MKNALFVSSRNWFDPSQPPSFHPCASLEDAKRFLCKQASLSESLGDEVIWQFLGFVTLEDGQTRLEFRIEEYPVEESPASSSPGNASKKSVDNMSRDEVLAEIALLVMAHPEAPRSLGLYSDFFVAPTSSRAGRKNNFAVWTRGCAPELVAQLRALCDRLDELDE